MQDSVLHMAPWLLRVAGSSPWLMLAAEELLDNQDPEQWQAMSQQGLQRLAPTAHAGIWFIEGRGILEQSPSSPICEPHGTLPLPSFIHTEGSVTHNHNGNCSMWLVSQEGSQPQQALQLKRRQGEISIHAHLIWVYSLITINFKSPVSIAL